MSKSCNLDFSQNFTPFKFYFIFAIWNMKSFHSRFILDNSEVHETINK